MLVVGLLAVDWDVLIQCHDATGTAHCIENREWKDVKHMGLDRLLTGMHHACVHMEKRRATVDSDSLQPEGPRGLSSATLMRVGRPLGLWTDVVNI